MSTGRLRGFPDSLVLLSALIVAAQLATYVVPAGEFERDGLQVVPGTYRAVDANPLPPATFLTAIPAGLAAAQDIIFFVFIVGGVMAVVRATGTIDALIAAALHWLGGRPAVLMAGMMLLFAVGSSTVGMAEEYLPFVPVLVVMCRGLRLDAVAAVGIIYIGAGIGYGCAAINPFTVQIAQRIAGLDLLSGQGLRWGLLLLCAAVGADHLRRHARRCRENPQPGPQAEAATAVPDPLSASARFTPRRVAVAATFALAIAGFVYGVTAWGWYLTELCAVFLALAVASAAIGGLGPNRAAAAFTAGAAELTKTALLIGFARTIEVILTDGRVIDTVIHAVAQPLQGLPAMVSATAMLGVQSVGNFFIPSGSGQAYVTMPIMAPLADLTGVSRQTAVLAYQFGDGFTNMLVPTNAVLIGVLALAQVPYHRWVRFVWPLLVKLYLIAIAALWAAVAWGY